MRRNSNTLTSTRSPFLTRKQLAERWHLSIPTMDRFKGIPYIRMGCSTKVLYRLSDVESFEKAHEIDPQVPEIG